MSAMPLMAAVSEMPRDVHDGLDSNALVDYMSVMFLMTVSMIPLVTAMSEMPVTFTMAFTLNPLAGCARDVHDDLDTVVVVFVIALVTDTCNVFENVLMP